MRPWGESGPTGRRPLPRSDRFAQADKSERCRREASRSLGQIGTAAIAPLHRRGVAHKDAATGIRAGAAVEGLGFLSVPDDPVLRPAAPPPRAAHDATDPAVRAAAVKSLARTRRVPDDVLAADSATRTSDMKTNRSGWPWSIC